MAEARQRAVVVGASSGIGEALARELADAGYDVGLTARRRDLLEDLGRVLPTKAYVARMDVTDLDAARESFQNVCDAMDGADVVVLNAGVAFENPDLEWEPELDTVDTNVRGFSALATAAMDRFETQGHGHLVGVSSVAARFGNGEWPAYSASKAFVSNYLAGLRYRTGRLDADVDVTTVEPGYVDTDLAGGDFWKADRETAAEQIRRAIEKKRRHAFITRRWVFVAKLIDYMPDVLKRRLFR